MWRECRTNTNIEINAVSIFISSMVLVPYNPYYIFYIMQALGSGRTDKLTTRSLVRILRRTCQHSVHESVSLREYTL